MERGLILLVAALVVYVAPDVKGTEHLSFSNNTEVNVTRDGCGVSKLCVETPDDCDPAGNASCLFMSARAGTPKPPNGTDVYVGLRGYSMGYIAVGLTKNASEAYTMLFICGQNSSNNASFFFRTVMKNNTNGDLSDSERDVKEIRGTVTGNVIKCEFVIPYLNSSTPWSAIKSTTDNSFVILLGNGTVNGSTIDPFNPSLTTERLDLSNPASNIPTTMAPNTTTMAPNTTTTNGSGAVQPHAVLLLLSALALSVMLRV